jgi:hypothetical protein
MNWSWTTSLDHVWASSSFPMWLTLAAAGFFGVIVLFTLLRADRSVANGALTVITLLAVGLAVAASLRGYGPETRSAPTEMRVAAAPVAGSPALACVEDLAGDVVQQACEKAVFGSAESTAAAVNYMASMISRLTALGDAATAQRTMTSEMQAVRRTIERDRYGLVSQVLLARERCSPMECATYRSLTDNHQIITNMDEHLYDNLVAHYAPMWNAPPQVANASGSPLATMPASVPTGRPTNAEFPSAANTPAVSIMAPEPGTGAKPAAPPPAARAEKPPPAEKPAQAEKPAPAERPAQAAAPQSIVPPYSQPPAAAPSKKQTAAKQRAPAPAAAPGAPAQLSPAPAEPDAAND